jgi:hypothetical protein
MDRSTSYAPSFLFGCFLAAGVLIHSPAISETVTVRVPVKLKNILPEAKAAQVWCRLRDAEGKDVAGPSNKGKPLTGDSLDEVFEVTLDLPADKFALAKSYHCYLALGPAYGHSIVRSKGMAPDPTPEVQYQGRPDEFFRSEVSGPIGNPVAQPAVKTKGLQVGPKN